MHVKISSTLSVLASLLFLPGIASADVIYDWLPDPFESQLATGFLEFDSSIADPANFSGEAVIRGEFNFATNPFTTSFDVLDPFGPTAPWVISVNSFRARRGQLIDTADTLVVETSASLSKFQIDAIEVRCNVFDVAGCGDSTQQALIVMRGKWLLRDTTTPVAEPQTSLLFVTGLLLIGTLARRQIAQ